MELKTKLQYYLEAFNSVPKQAKEMGYELITEYWGRLSVCYEDSEKIKATYRELKKDALRYSNEKIRAELLLVLKWKELYYEKLGLKSLPILYEDLYKDFSTVAMQELDEDGKSYILQTIANCGKM